VERYSGAARAQGGLHGDNGITRYEMEWHALHSNMHCLIRYWTGWILVLLQLRMQTGGATSHGGWPQADPAFPRFLKIKIKKYIYTHLLPKCLLFPDLGKVLFY